MMLRRTQCQQAKIKALPDQFRCFRIVPPQVPSGRISKAVVHLIKAAGCPIQALRWLEWDEKNSLLTRRSMIVEKANPRDVKSGMGYDQSPTIGSRGKSDGRLSPQKSLSSSSNRVLSGNTEVWTIFVPSQPVIVTVAGCPIQAHPERSRTVTRK